MSPGLPFIEKDSPRLDVYDDCFEDIPNRSTLLALGQVH